MPEASGKKATFRSAVKEFAESSFGKDFSLLKAKQQSEAMLRFYLKHVYSNTVEELTDEDIDEGYCDGADAGVDFIRRDNGRVLLVQAKYRSDGTSTEALEELTHFQDVVRRLHPKLGESWRKNSKVKEVAAEIEFEQDTFHLEYITLGRFQDTASAVLAEGVKEITELPELVARSTLTFFDETGLNTQYRIALSQSGGIPEVVELHLAAPSSRTPAAIEMDGSHKTMIGVVSGTVLANAYRSHKEPLFTLNIRSFLGRTKTNREIIRSIKHAPESFLNYNNGIACICKSYDWNPDSRRLLAHKMQVVNGAQTIRCLVAAGQELSDKVLVPFKLTAIEDYYRADEEKFYGNVIRFSNTQNVIKDLDFRSNDPVQIDLQRRFADLTFRGKKVHYQIKRTDKRPSGSVCVIPIGELCKNLYSFFFNPIDFASSSNFLFDDAEDKGYTRLFGDGKAVFTSLEKDQFHEYSASWFLCQVMGEWRAGDRKQLSAEGKMIAAAALERTYFLFATVRALLEKKHGAAIWREELRKLWKPDWADNETGAKLRSVRELYVLAKGVVITCYEEAAGVEGFNHRNWTRSQTTYDRLLTYVAHVVPEKFIPTL